jgi:hypothetical protein
MEPHDSIWVVRIWCDIHTNPVLRCFDNLEGLSCGDLQVGVVTMLSSCLTVSD